MNAVNVNGREHAVDEEALGAPLADFLRDELGLAGAHLGCRNGDCGACTVLIDGAPFKSCIVPTGRARGRRVETIESLADGTDLTEVQDSFWKRNAFQCGFCIAGHLLCTVAALRQNPEASWPDVEDDLSGNLCRCTGYHQIAQAVHDLCSDGTRPGAVPAP